MYGKISLWGLIKQKALRGTAAQQHKSDSISQLSLRLPLFLLFYHMPSLPSLLMTEMGSGAPLSHASRALGEAPDVFLHRCGPAASLAIFHASNSCSLHLQSVCISNSIWKSASLPLFFLPSPHSLWVMALIENANCNQISWIKMSGLKMGDIRDKSHGSAWEMMRLVEIMRTRVWSVYELLIFCFGRWFGCQKRPPLPCRQKLCYSGM